MIEAGLYSMISGDSTIASIAPRGYQVEVPPDDNKYPCWSYRLIGGGGEQTFKTSGVLRQRIELNGWAHNAETARAIRDRIFLLMDAWAGVLPNSVNVLGTNLANPGTDFDPGESRIFRCMVEFYVLYTLPA